MMIQSRLCAFTIWCRVARFKIIRGCAGIAHNFMALSTVIRRCRSD